MGIERGARKAAIVAVGVALAVLSPATPPATATALAPSAPIVRMPFPADDGSLNPYSFEVGYQLVMLVYDSLLWRDAEGVPRPWLAESVEVSPDGRRVSLRLAAGATWHDGPPVTSADVAFTFEFVRSHPHPRFTGQLEFVQRVDTPDPATVVIQLRQPSPGFLDQPLADLPILPRHRWEGLPDGRFAPGGLPVGSGPYRLAGHRPGESYRFEANPAYFRGPPAVAAIEVPIIPGAEDMVRALQRRQVDAIPVSLPRNAAVNVNTLGVRLAKGDSYLGTVLLLNARRGPFDRVEVRQAVAKALDLERIARNVGDAVPASRGYLHPRSPYAAAEELHAFDEAAARATLSGSGLAVTVLAPDNDVIKLEAGRQAVLALQRAGVAADLKAVSRAELGKAVGEDGSPPSFEAAVWVAPPLVSYDPGLLARLFGSDPQAAQFNYSGYASGRFDEAARRVATTAEPVARRAAVSEALAVLAADVPVVPLFFAGGAYAYRPAVYDGWVFVKGAGILDKRSFVEPRAGAAAGRSPDRAGGGPGVDPLWLGVAGLAAVAAVLGGLAAVRGRGGRRG